MKGFIGPCILSFFVVEFVLIMQKMWQIIDNILGKGYGMLDYLELLYYFGLMMTPMALPLTILLSSVMVYGDMAENYELSSIKSSGTSFFRMLRAGLFVATIVFIISLVASNYLKPYASEGFEKKYRNMKSNSLTFDFDENIFNQEFKDFSIRIGKKHDDGKTIEDIMIYDHTDPDASVLRMIRAKRGQMYTSPDQKFLVMDLENGYQKREIRSEAEGAARVGYNEMARPMINLDFSKLRLTFDLAEMLDLNTVNVNHKRYEMMNASQLVTVMDSLDQDMVQATERCMPDFNLTSADTSNTLVRSILEERSRKRRFREQVRSIDEVAAEQAAKKAAGKTTKKSALSKSIDAARPLTKYEKTAKQVLKTNRIVTVNTDAIDENTTSLVQLLDVKKAPRFFDKLKTAAEGARNNIKNNKQESRMYFLEKKKYTFTLHQMFSYATICILFLFIGAPAGAIVRKGGFGYPLLIAIAFYLTFVMSSIFGRKLMGSGALAPWQGAWLPCLLLLPFAIYFSWRAVHDNKPLFKPWFAKIRGRIKKDN